MRAAKAARTVWVKKLRRLNHFNYGELPDAVTAATLSEYVREFERIRKLLLKQMGKVTARLRVRA